MAEDKQNISYNNLADLSRALVTAMKGNLMSLEDARFIWKRHLIQVGWKKVQPVAETEVVTTKKTVNLKVAKA